MHYSDAKNQGAIAGGNVSFEKACLTQAPPLSASESIIDRLRGLRSNFVDLRMGVDRIADKIVGVSPTPPGCGASIGNVRVEPSCFLDSLQEVISDLEQVARETREHHERLLRSF
jgi:hypothetical protein